MNPVPPVHVLLYRVCIRGKARSNTTSECDRRSPPLHRHLPRTKINRGPWSASTQTRGLRNGPGGSLSGRWKWCVNVHVEQIWSFALIVSLIFADVLPPALELVSLPHLFSFHQQDFKAHFVSSATVPPSLPPSLSSSPSSSRSSSSNQVPQLEVKSLAIPPSLALAPPSPSIATSELSATPSASGQPSLFRLLCSR